jgi:transaldolase
MTENSYFHRVHAETPTRWWVNNPTLQEVDLALAYGAVCCTTNPAFMSKIIPVSRSYTNRIIDQVVAETGDDDVAAERAYHHAACDIMEKFLPLHKASGGQLGFVTIQGDPRAEEWSDKIVAEMLRASRLGPNFMAKIPVTESGIEAMEAMVAHDIAICATEIFSISQMIAICDAYDRASRKTGNQPPFFVTHITGIFDQHWGEMVKAEKIDIAPEVLKEAGSAIARKEYQIMTERKLPGILLGGGARGLQHFTEFVGGNVHITINYGTARELIELDGPVVDRIGAHPPGEVIQELEAKLPAFSRAYHEGSLPVRQFKDFGPVVFFRNAFNSGYSRLLEEVAARRAATQSPLRNLSV